MSVIYPTSTVDGARAEARQDYMGNQIGYSPEDAEDAILDDCKRDIIARINEAADNLRQPSRIEKLKHALEDAVAQL